MKCAFKDSWLCPWYSFGFSLKYQSVVNCVVGWNKLAVLDIEDPIIETSVSTTGTMKGVHLQETITFSGTRAAEREEIHGVGKGVVMTSGSGEGGEPEMVTYTGEGIGRIYSFRKYKAACYLYYPLLHPIFRSCS